MTIYTKKGDKGKTSLYQKNGKQNARISKDSVRVVVLGTIDELNSYLGIITSISDDEVLIAKIVRVQKNLLRIGSILAGAKLIFSKIEVKDLEKEIDVIEDKLPVLKNFILPGGSKTAVHLHYARTLARRLERTVVEFATSQKINSEILKYLNRLSDYFFTLARLENYIRNIEEKIWKTSR